ncbi:MAG: mechanosensitive ion channel [Crocinitomicaceae bacterium]|jgi:miniconductance mechanosensitive channel|tara:strand:+ start:142 stop:1407 length:1266 start_codon:yes stop_codon:yes gene_type:complete
MVDRILNWIKSFYNDSNDIFLKDTFQNDTPWITLILVLCSAVVFIILWYISRTVMRVAVQFFASKSKTKLDDYLVSKKVFSSLAHIVPLMALYSLLSLAFFAYPVLFNVMSKFIDIVIIIAIWITVNRAISAINMFFEELEKFKDKPIDSYFQIFKIILGVIFFLLILSEITGQSPASFLAYFGAFSAVILLVFKDTILGFVGSIQLSANDMIRKGDWITMERYGADGNIEEINLTTVKVRNFDRTITTIPTYSFISDSFNNWRGMEESDGRRIKRSMFIETDSIALASESLIQTLEKSKILGSFLNQEIENIKQYNDQHALDTQPNKRKFTNIGLFRRYIEFYLKNHPGVNSEMTLMVRQLQPTDKGLPLEVYCFSQTKVWEAYELIIADLFDHFYSVVQEFELYTFESPSGNDIQKLKS